MEANLTSRLANFLSKHVYDLVYDEPERPQNRVYQLRSLTPTPVKRSIQRNDLVIKLPDNINTYMVFCLDAHIASELMIPDNNWISLQVLQNTTKFNMQAYTKLGLHLFSSYTFLTRTPGTNKIILAVRESAITESLKSPSGLDRIYLQQYYDPASPQGVAVSNVVVAPATNRTTLKANVLAADKVYINGFVIRNFPNDYVFDDGDLVELVNDSSYANSFDIDITQETPRVSYISEVDDRSRTVVHIPKNMNELNKIISSHFCDIYVFPKNTGMKDTHGFKVVIPASYPCRQITHNDFGICDVILNAQMTALEADEVVLKVYIRYVSNNSLIDDRNYIKQLYHHTDEEIMRFFENMHRVKMPFWTASALEASAYSKAISDTPDLPSWGNVHTFAEILGPYNTLDLITKRKVEFAVSDSRNFVVDIPPVIETNRVHVVVYIKGIKVDDANVGWTVDKSRRVHVKISDDQVLYVGDRISIVLHEAEKDHVVLVEPSVNIQLMPRVMKTFRLYKVSTLSAAEVTINDTVYTGYEDVSDELGNYVELTYINNVQYIKFKPVTYGDRYLVVFEGGLTNINLDVDDIISAENPLVINLRSKVTEDLIGGVSFELTAHTGYSSATGSVAQPSNVPVDLLNINRQVWHPFSGESSSVAWEQRFIGTTDRSETDFTYTLDVSQQGIHTIIGYRVGFLMEQPPSLSTDAKVSNGYVEDAIDPDIVQFSGVAPATDFSKVTYVEHLQQVATWDFLVDDVVVDTITKEQWDGCKSESRTFLLNTPTLVNSSFTFRMKGSNNELIIALAKIEPIFANDVTYCAKVPYLGNKTCYVHLNDKLLVEDVDYKIVDSRIGDVVVDSQLVVQNKEFLKSSGNKLNILLTRDLTLDKSASLLSGDYLDLNVGTTAHDNSISIIDYDNKFLWFDNLSFMSIDGVLVSNLSDEFAKVMVDSSAYRQGALIGLKTTVPKTSLEYLKESFSSEDRLMMFKVRDYFIADDVATPLPELPQAGTYALYCSTVTWIMKDVLDGEVIPYDPDPRRILSNMPQYKRAFETDVFRSLVLNKNYFTLDPFITDTVSPSDPVVIQLMQGVTL